MNEYQKLLYLNRERVLYAIGHAEGASVVFDNGIRLDLKGTDAAAQITATLTVDSSTNAETGTM